MKIFSLLILTIFINVILAEEPELDPDMAKKSKVLACIALTKARINKDVAFIDKLTQTLNKHFDITDGKSKILSLSLVNCYSKINIHKAFEIIQLMHQQSEIDPITPDHKELLGLENSQDNQEKMSKDNFLKDYQEINNILRELNKEHDDLKSNRDSKQQGKKTQQQKTKPTGGAKEKKTDYFSMVNRIMADISPYIALDNYFGLLIMIVVMFILLSSLRKMLTKPKPRRHQVIVEEPEEEIEEEEKKYKEHLKAE